MKVFISWSGDRSRDVANLLRDWVSCVLQAVKPWVSTRDIDRGSLWFNEISGQLQEAAVGVICLTQQNKNQPWILFEAGALAKGLSSARVCTLLIDLSPGEIKDPLAQFNHTLPNKEGLYALVVTLNGALGAAGLEAKVLEQVFETYWPQFETGIGEVLANTPDPEVEPPRKQNEILNEVLSTVRTMSNRLARVESQAQFPAIDSPLHILRDEQGSEPTPLWRRTAHAKARKLLAAGVPKDAALKVLTEAMPKRLAIDALKTVAAELGIDP